MFTYQSKNATSYTTEQRGSVNYSQIVKNTSTYLDQNRQSGTFLSQDKQLQDELLITDTGDFIITDLGFFLSIGSTVEIAYANITRN